MARTETTPVELGFTAPDFYLPDLQSDKFLKLTDVRGEIATVIMFICNHCPYVRHIMPELVKTAKEYEKKGVSFVAVNSNDIENYPDDSPDKMKIFAREYGFSFPYLFDESQETAKNYFAACTPDFNIFDKKLKCVYRGNFDDSTPKNGKPVTGKNMRNALDLILAGKSVPVQIPSVGCNIKWKNPL
jgi:thiol-disulfide isomerase/thioredoxin